MRASVAALALSLVVVAATSNSCSAEPAAPRGPQPIPQQGSLDGIEERRILLSDGREVVCITWVDRGYTSSSTAAGISCDWEHAEGHE